LNRGCKFTSTTPNFKKASFLTPEMVDEYHKNEQEHPGYGVACFVHNDFLLTAEDLSQLNPDKVQFHIDA
jgi:hypothetical protein